MYVHNLKMKGKKEKKKKKVEFCDMETWNVWSFREFA